MKVGTDGVLLGAWAQGGQRMLDIGTGTGLVALMLAQRYKQSRMVGIEIDEASFQQAQRNVMDSPFASRVTVVHEALQQFSSGETFDSIVSNPPFFVDALRAVCGRGSVTVCSGMLFGHHPSRLCRSFCG